MRRYAPLVLLGALACSREAPARQDAPAAGQPAAAAARAKTACRLFTQADLQMLDPTIVMGNVVVDEPSFSECNFEDAGGVVLLNVKAYWSGGRQQWDTWRLAQGMGEEIFRAQEGVGLDSIVKQGPVPGLGDAAYFSPLLPSLLLKGDVLVEIMMPTVRNPEARFVPLARSLLTRM
jgi:hypothetical protein